MLIPSSILTPSVSLGGGRNTAPLSQIAGIGALFDLDATLSSSYSGTGQTWANLIAAPADGSSQTAYDFWRGGDGSASTDDPTFNGTPNDPAAYWSLDGGDFFTIAAGNTAILNGLHKTGGAGSGPMTFIIAINCPTISTTRFGGTAASGSNDGLAIYLSSAHLRVNQYTGGSAASNIDSTHTVATSTDCLLAMSFDFTASTAHFAENARSFSSVSLIKNTNTATASGAFALGATGKNYSPTAAGTLIYGAYAFNRILSDADLSVVVDILNSRHGRTYA